MHRILDYKPETEAVVVSRVHSFVMEALERQFPHLRPPKSVFDTDEATVVTNSPLGLEEGPSKVQLPHAAGSSSGEARRRHPSRNEAAVSASSKRASHQELRRRRVPLEADGLHGEKTYIVAIVSFCAVAALLALWLASS